MTLVELLSEQFFRQEVGLVYYEALLFILLEEGEDHDHGHNHFNPADYQSIRLADHQCSYGYLTDAN